MAKIFQIISPSETVKLDSDGKAELELTVTNLARSVGGRAVLIPIDDTDEGWLSIVGEDEKELAANLAETFTVGVEIPAEAPDGEYPFRMDVISELNPEEDFSEGPTITAIKEPVRKRRWWWIVLLVLSLLLLLVLLFVLLGGEDSEEGTDGASEASSTSEEVVDGEAAAPEEGASRGTVIVGLETPNLMGLSPAEATEQARMLGLGLEPVKWLGTPGLTVTAQNPRPGSFVQEGGTIELELETEVPNLIGLEVAQVGSALEAAGLDQGKVNYRRTDRQEPGLVLSQTTEPSIRAAPGTSIGVSVSLGSCSWTIPHFGNFGMAACPSGSAASGLYCSNRFRKRECAAWRVHCCPYLPGTDPESTVRESGWVAPQEPVENRSGAVFDGLECEDRFCLRMRARYLSSPNLEKGSGCRRVEVDGKVQGAGRCPEDMFVSSFECTDGKCETWKMDCCPVEAATRP